MSNVINLDTITCIDLTSERVLNAALEHELDEVVVIGYDKNGEFYFAGNKASGADALWVLQMAIHKLMKIGEEGVIGVRT